MAPFCLVFDTNVLVSALVLRSPQVAWLRSAWQSGAIQPLISRKTREELIRVLSYPKFKLCARDKEELLKDYLPFCKVVAIPNPPPLVPQCRDRFDQPFLELALAGDADALVTGDQDILSLTGELLMPILSPNELRRELFYKEEKNQ